MAEEFYTILTDTGKAKIANSQVTGVKVDLVEMAVGDGGGAYYNPISSQIALKNEVWRGNIGSTATDETNANWIVIETIVPAESGGFTVREVGIFDIDGDMIAIGKYPETYKPLLDAGSAKDLYIRMIIEVTNASAVTLKIDPAVTIASREYVDTTMANHEDQTVQAHGAHDSQDVIFSRDVNGRLTGIDVKKPDGVTGVNRISAVLSFDVNGRLASVNEKAFADDGVTLQSEATATLVYTNSQLDKVEVR